MAPVTQTVSICPASVDCLLESKFVKKLRQILVSVPTLIGAVVLLAVAYLCMVPFRLGGSGAHSNETAAVNSLHAVYKAEIEYQQTYPDRGFTCLLQELGGDPGKGLPTSTSAQILTGDLPGGTKNGYNFKIVNCVQWSVHGAVKVTSFEAIAVPQKPGKTGNRGLCVNQLGELKMDPSGGTNCTQIVE